MSNNLKAASIILALLVAVTGLVYLLLYGVGGRSEVKSILPLPTDNAAKAYVLDKKLLVSINTVTEINAGGPNFKAIEGTDNTGNDKTVWLTGKDDNIVERGSALLKDGLSKEAIYAKLLEKKISRDQVEEMFISPYDYTSGTIIWFVRTVDIRKHWITYDYKTGEVLSDLFQDPNAWKL